MFDWIIRRINLIVAGKPSRRSALDSIRRELPSMENECVQDIYDPHFVKGVFDRCSAGYRYWSQIASFGFIFCGDVSAWITCRRCPLNACSGPRLDGWYWRGMALPSETAGKHHVDHRRRHLIGDDT